MKKIIIALSLALLPTISFAGPRPPDYPQRPHHDVPSRPSFNNHRGPGHFSHRPPLYREPRFGVFLPPVVIVPAPRYESRLKEIREEIEVTSKLSRSKARVKWQEACSDWKEDVFDDYRRVEEVSCGVMKCTYEGDETVCYSSAEATVRM